MAHTFDSITAVLGGVDPLAFIYLVGCLAFLWAIWTVVTEDRDLGGKTPDRP